MAFAAGESIFTEGDPGDMMYGVISGTVHIVYKDEVINVIDGKVSSNTSSVTDTEEY